MTSNEISDQVEDIKPSNNKSRFMKIKFIYRVLFISFVVNIKIVYISFETNLVYFMK